MNADFFVSGSDLDGGDIWIEELRGKLEVDDVPDESELRSMSPMEVYEIKNPGEKEICRDRLNAWGCGLWPEGTEKY